MKEFSYTINGNKYDVAVGEIKENKVEVTVNGEAYTVETEQKKTKKERVTVKSPVAAAPAVGAAAPTATPSTNAASGAGEPVKAPLPGTIKEVCVAVGDKVAEGQTVIVLEAMKMANNIETEKAGTVTSINVKVGDSVMEDDVMIIVG